MLKREALNPKASNSSVAAPNYLSTTPLYTGFLQGGNCQLDIYYVVHPVCSVQMPLSYYRRGRLGKQLPFISGDGRAVCFLRGTCFSQMEGIVERRISIRDDAGRTCSHSDPRGFSGTFGFLETTGMLVSCCRCLRVTTQNQIVNSNRTSGVVIRMSIGNMPQAARPKRSMVHKQCRLAHKQSRLAQSRLPLNIHK